MRGVAPCFQTHTHTYDPRYTFQLGGRSRWPLRRPQTCIQNPNNCETYMHSCTRMETREKKTHKCASTWRPQRTSARTKKWFWHETDYFHSRLHKLLLLFVEFGARQKMLLQSACVSVCVSARVMLQTFYYHYILYVCVTHFMTIPFKFADTTFQLVWIWSGFCVYSL